MTEQNNEGDIKTQENDNIIIDDNLKEIIKKLQKERKLSKEEIEKLQKEALDSVQFVQKIDQIDLDFTKYVVFTDGNEQLIYEDGEFFVVSTTDANQKKEKKKKEEAKNMYLEYFIRYILNPIIKQRDINEHAKGVKTPSIQKEEKEKMLDKIRENEKKEKKIEKKQEKIKEVKKPEMKKAKEEEKEIEISDIEI